MSIQHSPPPLPLVVATELQKRAEQAFKESGDDPDKTATALIRLVAEDKAARDHLMQLGAREFVRETLRNRGS